MTRYAILQAGAPSPVINASLAGFLHHLDGLAEVVGVHGGAGGLVAGRLAPVPVEDLAALAARPGAALGAGRYLPGPDELAAAAERLRDNGIEGIALNGGNGTMGLAAALEAAAARTGVPLRVAGIPKTIDNDLLGTDRSPGFLTAGTFVAHAVQALGADLRAMAPLEKVRVVEVLGRNVGWLGLAASLFRGNPQDAPHLVYTPEAPLVFGEFAAAVDAVVRREGHALVVVAEGAAPEISGDEFTVARPDRLLRNGVSRIIADRLAAETGLPVRAEVLGMVQRAASWMAPGRDRADAWAVGAAAAGLLHEGASGVMAGLDPVDSPGAASTCSPVPLAGVAELTRSVPYDLAPGCPDAPADFRAWWERLTA
ncbi:6-phosphofructokinase [Amycolatopsis endophytica]|uniref:6-phosphofructokinase 1 n=1 Tax=Amycolatopsis endophytica TaxID=860233 RepID=A0A853BF24_9PSEU|nr:6-phosphofructokinase [Amycolatopsis endophytica]NYI93251.1 6-phosphofructokinase 1 [Amycolatopsis endophytica]